jgi:uncharacterized protein YndB with AHSA1/START domain
VRVSRTRTVPAPVEDVWRVAADPHHLPRWWPLCERVESVDATAWTSVLRSDRGKIVRADYRVVEHDPPRRRAWTLELAGGPFERLLSEHRTELSLEPEGEWESRWVAEMYRRIGLGDDVPWRHYLGWLGDQPVATATLLLAAGVAGVYFVLTAPEARRQGIGRAITLAALHEGRGLGFHVGVLGASPMGLPIYRRLGFQDYCHIAVYEWHLPASH